MPENAPFDENNPFNEEDEEGEADPAFVRVGHGKRSFMSENAPFDENNPFFAPSPTTTASDVLRIVEAVQERKRLLHSQLMTMLPNLVASHVITVCASLAAVETRSATFKMDTAELYGKIPSKIRAGILNGRESETVNACSRILMPLAAQVQGILTHLGFTCTVTSGISLEISISW